MTQPMFRTLGELRHSMAVRLGFGAQGNATIVHKDIFNEYLRSSQVFLHEQYTDLLLQDFVDDVELNAGQALYDVVEQADIKRIDVVAIKRSDQWCELRKGIRFISRDDNEAMPTNYLIRYGTTNTPQLEVWPRPDQSYTLGYTFSRALSRFTQDEDKTSIDSEMVLCLALADAASHYGLKTADRFDAKAKRLRDILQQRKNAMFGGVVRRDTPGHGGSFDSRLTQIEYQTTYNQLDNLGSNGLTGESSDVLIAE